jgi:heme-degrading monooxygenase HmoA
MIAQTPKPPYYAIIFTSIRSNIDDGYSEMSSKMLELAKKQPGFLGVESVREKLGVSVSYWKDLSAVRKWKENTDHLLAQKIGREKWYLSYKTRITKVENDYDFQKM